MYVFAKVMAVDAFILLARSQLQQVYVEGNERHAVEPNNCSCVQRRM